MNKKKLVKLGASLALVGVVGVGATLAYLQTEVQDLSNTFVLGNGYPTDKIALVLDEKYNGEGSVPTEDQSPVENSSDRTTDGNTYNVYPGADPAKDPRVSLYNTSPDSYIFVGIKGVDGMNSDGNHVTVDVNDSGENYWNKVSEDGTIDGIYVYASENGSELTDNAKIVETTGTASYLTLTPKLFDKVTIDSAITNAEVSDLKTLWQDNPIEIYAVAVQADDITYNEALTQASNALNNAMNPATE